MEAEGKEKDKMVSFEERMNTKREMLTKAKKQKVYHELEVASSKSLLEEKKRNEREKAYGEKVAAIERQRQRREIEELVRESKKQEQSWEKIERKREERRDRKGDGRRGGESKGPIANIFIEKNDIYNARVLERMEKIERKKEILSEYYTPLVDYEEERGERREGRERGERREERDMGERRGTKGSVGPASTKTDVRNEFLYRKGSRLSRFLSDAPVRKDTRRNEMDMQRQRLFARLEKIVLFSERDIQQRRKEQHRSQREKALHVAKESGRDNRDGETKGESGEEREEGEVREEGEEGEDEGRAGGVIFDVSNESEAKPRALKSTIQRIEESAGIANDYLIEEGDEKEKGSNGEEGRGEEGRGEERRGEESYDQNYLENLSKSKAERAREKKNETLKKKSIEVANKIAASASAAALRREEREREEKEKEERIAAQRELRLSTLMNVMKAKSAFKAVLCDKKGEQKRRGEEWRGQERRGELGRGEQGRGEEKYSAEHNQFIIESKDEEVLSNGKGEQESSEKEEFDDLDEERRERGGRGAIKGRYQNLMDELSIGEDVEETMKETRFSCKTLQYLMEILNVRRAEILMEESCKPFWRVNENLTEKVKKNFDDSFYFRKVKKFDGIRKIDYRDFEDANLRRLVQFLFDGVNFDDLEWRDAGKIFNLIKKLKILLREMSATNRKVEFEDIKNIVESCVKKRELLLSRVDNKSVSLVFNLFDWGARANDANDELIKFLSDNIVPQKRKSRKDKTRSSKYPTPSFSEMHDRLTQIEAKLAQLEEGEAREEGDGLEESDERKERDGVVERTEELVVKHKGALRREDSQRKRDTVTWETKKETRANEADEESKEKEDCDMETEERRQEERGERRGEERGDVYFDKNTDYEYLMQYVLCSGCEPDCIKFPRIWNLWSKVRLWEMIFDVGIFDINIEKMMESQKNNLMDESSNFLMMIANSLGDCEHLRQERQKIKCDKVSVFPDILELLSINILGGRNGSNKEEETRRSIADALQKNIYKGCNFFMRRKGYEVKFFPSKSSNPQNWKIFTEKMEKLMQVKQKIHDKTNQKEVRTSERDAVKWDDELNSDSQRDNIKFLIERDIPEDFDELLGGERREGNEKKGDRKEEINNITRLNEKRAFLTFLKKKMEIEKLKIKRQQLFHQILFDETSYEILIKLFLLIHGEGSVVEERGLRGELSPTRTGERLLNAKTNTNEGGSPNKLELRLAADESRRRRESGELSEGDMEGRSYLEGIEFPLSEGGRQVDAKEFDALYNFIKNFSLIKKGKASNFDKEIFDQCLQEGSRPVSSYGSIKETKMREIDDFTEGKIERRDMKTYFEEQLEQLEKKNGCVSTISTRVKMAALQNGAVNRDEQLEKHQKISTLFDEKLQGFFDETLLGNFMPSLAETMETAKENFESLLLHEIKKREHRNLMRERFARLRRERKNKILPQDVEYYKKEKHQKLMSEQHFYLPPQPTLEQHMKNFNNIHTRLNYRIANKLPALESAENYLRRRDKGLSTAASLNATSKLEAGRRRKEV